MASDVYVGAFVVTSERRARLTPLSLLRLSQQTQRARRFCRARQQTKAGDRFYFVKFTLALWNGIDVECSPLKYLARMYQAPLLEIPARYYGDWDKWGSNVDISTRYISVFTHIVKTISNCLILGNSKSFVALIQEGCESTRISNMPLIPNFKYSWVDQTLCAIA